MMKMKQNIYYIKRTCNQIEPERILWLEIGCYLINIKFLHEEIIITYKFKDGVYHYKTLKKAPLCEIHIQ